MALNNQGILERAIIKNWKTFLCLIFKFLLLQEDYGQKKSPGHSPKLSIKTKRNIIKRLRNGKAML